MIKNDRHYTDFLKDQQFIRWQIMPDEELNDYWKQFIERNPHLTEELDRAVRYLKTTGLNARSLSSLDREQLMNRIRETIDRRENKKRVYGIFKYLSVASVVLFVAISGIALYVSWRDARRSELENIVGNLRESKDIQLIAGKKITSFPKDITLSINEEGETKVQSKGQVVEACFKAEKDEMTTLIVPYGKRSKITLSDGTKVWVNSGSELKFPATFSKKIREIFINGEIYIEVAKNTQKPFYVRASTFRINVYGTSFNVNSYLNAPAEVVLVEGSIALETTQGKNKTSTNLTPGEMAVLKEQGAIEKKKVDTGKYTSWKNGYLIFSETPITEVLTQVERLYNLSFDMGNNLNIQNKHCTGKLILSENLDAVLNTIATLSGTVYERSDEKIIIRNAALKTIHTDTLNLTYKKAGKNTIHILPAN